MEAFSIFRDGRRCVNSSDVVPCEIQQSRQHLRESRTAPTLLAPAQLSLLCFMHVYSKASLA